MSGQPGDNSQIVTMAERIENIELEIKDLQDARTEIYVEAKSNGHDVKALKAAIRRRKADAEKLAEHEMLVDSYMTALQSLVRPN